MREKEPYGEGEGAERAADFQGLTLGIAVSSKGQQCLSLLHGPRRPHEGEGRQKKSTLAGAQGELNSPEHAAAEAGLAIPSLEAATVQDEQPRAEPAARGLGAAHLQWHLVTGSPRWPVRKHRRSPAAGDGQCSTRPISLGSQATQPGSSGVAHAAGEGHSKKDK